MDAATQQIKKDSRQTCLQVLAAVLFVLLTGLSAEAQNGRLRSRDGAQSLVHDLQNPVQPFNAVRWDVQNRSRSGCVVQWTADAFVHRDLGAKADCGLQLTIVQQSNNGRWSVLQPQDQTEVASGRDQASVSIAAERQGVARIALQVLFTNDEPTSLVAGQYETVVTGTITAP
jgi:hypothetical protein